MPYFIAVDEPAVTETQPVSLQALHVPTRLVEQPIDCFGSVSRLQGHYSEWTAAGRGRAFHNYKRSMTAASRLALGRLLGLGILKASRYRDIMKDGIDMNRLATQPTSDNKIPAIADRRCSAPWAPAVDDAETFQRTDSAKANNTDDTLRASTGWSRTLSPLQLEHHADLEASLAQELTEANLAQLAAETDDDTTPWLPADVEELDRWMERMERLKQLPGRWSAYQLSDGDTQRPEHSDVKSRNQDETL